MDINDFKKKKKICVLRKRAWEQKSIEIKFYIRKVSHWALKTLLVDLGLIFRKFYFGATKFDKSIETATLSSVEL